MRSAFCNIVLSLYVDREPLNEIAVPTMCRIYKKISDENTIPNTDLFKKLIDKSLEFISEHTK